MSEAGTLYVVATPIGNLADASPRVLDSLRAVDILACEDTRRTWQLLAHFGIPRPPRMASYREQNEPREAARLIGELEAGRSVALCTDGGYPGISDPGYRLVSLAAERGVPIQVIPGPCAATLALVLSGLPTSSYTFKGFAPRKPGRLLRFFADERDQPHTLIVYESPLRVAATLRAAAEALGNRRAAVCLELTKKFERVRRGFLSGLCEEFAAAPPRGEAVIVIAGNNPKFACDAVDET